MNESYKRGLYRHERRESGRGTEKWESSCKRQTWTMRRHMHAVYTPHKGDWSGKLCIAVSWSPPPILSTLFCSISFITVSWLRNQAIVQLLDHEGQQKIHRGFETGPQSVGGFSKSHWWPWFVTDARGHMSMNANPLAPPMILTFRF